MLLIVYCYSRCLWGFVFGPYSFMQYLVSFICFAIVWLKKRKRDGCFTQLCSCCRVAIIDMCLFRALLLVSLWSVTVAFSVHGQAIAGVFAYLVFLVLVMVVWLFLAMPWVCLRFVIVVYPDHTHFLFMSSELQMSVVIDKNAVYLNLNDDQQLLCVQYI